MPGASGRALRVRGTKGRLRWAKVAGLGGAWLLGSVPFTNYAALRWAGRDLRDVGNGTVSGTGLFRVAGWWPLVLAGSADVAKGAAGALACPPMGGPAAVCGHNWSPLLGWEGGRGLSPMLGAAAVVAPEGAAALALGMAVGRLASNTSLGSLVGLGGAVAISAARGGRSRAAPVAAMAACVLAKRAAGNGRPRHTPWRVVVHRLLFDCDRRERP